MDAITLTEKFDLLSSTRQGGALAPLCLFLYDPHKL